VGLADNEPLLQDERLGLASDLKPVFHFNRIVTYRSIFFCVEVISSTLVVRKQRNTPRFATIEVENRLYGSWTLEQGENFMINWQDDEPLLQVGRGQKRSMDEVNDGAGTSEQVSDNFFTLANVKQVKVKKFSTTGMDYTVQFMDTFAQLELSQ
jgi:hypothetical protein